MIKTLVLLAIPHVQNKSKPLHGRTHEGLVGRHVKSSCGGRPEAERGLEAVEAAGADGRRRVGPVQQVRRRRRSRERVGRRQEALSEWSI